MDPQQAYLQNKINSATPGELVIMLYDGLIKFSNEARELLSNTDAESQRLAAEKVDRSLKIITELNGALNFNHSPELCQRLSSLYTFFVDELSRSLREKDAAVIGNILPMIENLRNGWSDAEDNLRKKPDSSA